MATYNIAFNITGTTAPTVGAVTVNGSDAKNVTVTNAETKGVIAITLDHEPGSVTLADNTGLGQQMKGVADGNTLKFSYWDLEYGHTYTLKIPAGTLKDVYGDAYGEEVTVTFTTKAVPDNVPHALYNFVVTHKQSFNAKTQTAGERKLILPDDVLANLDEVACLVGKLVVDLAAAGSEVAVRAFEQINAHGDGAYVERLFLHHLVGLKYFGYVYHDDVKYDAFSRIFPLSGT